MQFTFVAEEKCEILLYDKKTFCLLERITVPSAYSVGHVYSIALSGADWEGICYLYQIGAHRVVDPYARIIVGRERWADESRYDRDYQVYGGFVTKEFVWKEQRTTVAPRDMVCYKLHLRGFTMKHGLPKAQQGNYKGVMARLEHLKKMGITTLEFQPLYEFEEWMFERYQVAGPRGKAAWQIKKADKINYWGYGMASYFAPKASYFGGERPDVHMKEMIQRIHQRGMECLMEMSFAEEVTGDYMLSALIYWVREYHVDGFHLVGCNLPIEEIADCPYLAKTKIFYDNIPQVLLDKQRGEKHLFVYNNDYQYELRKLQNHMEGNLRRFADQLKRQNKYYGFVNYAANNNGFTLWDSFSYGEKHNYDNGEENRDGTNVNFSYNYGREGKTKSRNIYNIRMQQMRNALATVFLGQGVPLLLAGDEVANSQEGNNNPYCQDNAVGWVQYSKSAARLQLQEFVRRMIAFRKSHKVLSQPEAFRMNDYLHVGTPDLSYHGREPWMMEIGYEQKAVGVLYAGAYEKEEDVYICYNFHYDDVKLALPGLPENRNWMLVMNTAEDQPSDFSPREWEDQQYAFVPGMSITIFVGQQHGKK